MRLLALGLVLAVMCQALRAQTPATLESSATLLRFDPAARALAGISHRAPERQFAAPTPAPLYAISLVDAKAPITLRDATALRLKTDGPALIIEADHDKPSPFTVTCRLAPAPQSPLILGRISLTSKEPLRLVAVQFPTLSVALPFSGDGHDDAVLIPYCDGALIQNPSLGAVDRSLPYPGTASMQFLAAIDKSGGVYLASYDNQAHAKSLVLQRRGKALELSIRHLLPQSPLSKWELPYDVVISTLHVNPANATSWEAAADLYRAWAVGQPWCAKTLKQRVDNGDVPRWLIEPSLFYAYSLRGQFKDRSFGNRLPAVLENAQAWKQTLDAPTTFMLMSWEKLDPWVTPDYFPPFGGADAFTQVTASLHKAGHHTLVFLSGLKWTLEKQVARAGQPPVKIDQRQSFEQRGKPHAIADPQGQPIIAGAPDRDVGQHAQICPTTPLAKEMLLDASRQCQKLGIDCVQADQLVGGGSPPCFHPQHSHPPGGGNWSAKALYEIFDLVRRDGKSRDPNYAFAIEEPAEFFIPVLDTYHARDYQQNRWPRSGSNVLGVPLFTHVYHDYLHGYGGDSAAVTEGPSDGALYHQAANLVCGKAPAVAVWTRWFDPTATDALQKRMLKSHVEIWRGPQREFLLYGRRMATQPLDVPTLSITFVDKDPKKDKRAIEFPAVLHSAWQLPDGRTARVYANLARTAVKFPSPDGPLSLEPGEALIKHKP